MPSSNSEEECNCLRSNSSRRRRIRNSLQIRDKSRGRRKRARRSSCEKDEEEYYLYLRRFRPKMCKRKNHRHATTIERIPFYVSSSEQVVVNEGLVSESASSMPFAGRNLGVSANPDNTVEIDSAMGNIELRDSSECWIQKLPQELLLLIFSYLPLAMLLLVIPHVCRKWENLSMDWTLWKAVEHLRIKSMVVTTKEVRALLRTIPKLKKLELVLRNDTEELLQELFQSSSHLEALQLDRCHRSGLHISILPHTVISMLELCPKLKSVTLTDTYFRCKDFYKALAEKFKSFERINISCTTRSEMNFFMDNLRKHVPEVDFQSVSMMGNADGKQIYWGPILGLVVRSNPSSPYHRHHASNEFPNYAF